MVTILVSEIMGHCTLALKTETVHDEVFEGKPAANLFNRQSLNPSNKTTIRVNITHGLVQLNPEAPFAWPMLAWRLDLFGRTQFRRLRTSQVIFPRGLHVNSKALMGIREKNEGDFSRNPR